MYRKLRRSPESKGKEGRLERLKGGARRFVPDKLVEKWLLLLLSLLLLSLLLLLFGKRVVVTCSLAGRRGRPWNRKTGMRVSTRVRGVGTVGLLMKFRN